MPNISTNDVDHIAKLARIKLTEAEKEKMAKEMASILEYVAKLNEVDTDNVPPTAQVTGLMNVFREDKPVTRESNAEAMLVQAPERSGDYVKVQGIFEENSK